MQQRMTPRQRQRDALERRALLAEREKAEREGRANEYQIEKGLRVVPVVDPMVQTAREMLASGQPDRFFAFSENLDAKQRYELVSMLTDAEHNMYVVALERADREVNR